MIVKIQCVTDSEDFDKYAGCSPKYQHLLMFKAEIVQKSIERGTSIGPLGLNSKDIFTD